MSVLVKLLIGLSLPCFFVDQAEDGHALVQDDRGAIREIATLAPEGSRVCGEAVYVPVATPGSCGEALPAGRIGLADLRRRP